MKKFVKKNILSILRVFVGAVAGYLYWQMIGCNSGSCSSTSDPLNSSVYGAIIGGFIFSMFQKKQEIQTH